MTRSILKSETNPNPVSGVLIVPENKMLPFDSVALGFSDTPFTHHAQFQKIEATMAKNVPFEPPDQDNTNHWEARSIYNTQSMFPQTV